MTAQPQDYYSWPDSTPGRLEVVGIDPTVFVTAAAPSKTNQTEFALGFVTIPESTGATTSWTANRCSQGNHNVAPGTHTVALPQFGYVLNGTTSWSLNVKAWVPFTLTAGGYVFQYGTPAGYTAPVAPVVDNVALHDHVDAAGRRSGKPDLLLILHGNGAERAARQLRRGTHRTR